MSTVTDLLTNLAQATQVAQSYQSGGLQLQLKTNFTPAVTLYNEATPQAGGNWLARVIGLQGGVRILDASGNQVAQFGDWPAVDPVRVGIALAGAAVLGFLAVRAIRNL